MQAQQSLLQAAVPGQPAPDDAEMEEEAAQIEADRCGEEDEDGDEDGSGNEEQDRREYGIYQCLPVEPGEPNWEEGEPQTVEEYLRRVRHEARALPDVVTCPLQPERRQQHVLDAPHSQQQDEAQQRAQQQRERVEGREHYSSCYLAADTGVQACDPALQPSATWTRDFLHHFAHLRRRLQREFELSSGQPAAPAGDGPRLAPHLLANSGGDAAVQEELEALSLNPPSACMPELQQLQGLDQLQVRRQLHAAMREAVRQQRLDPVAAQQLYALSARIEKPLHAGTCALYRQLLRVCAAQRAGLVSADDPLLPHLNILVTLAGAFFGQDEELAGMWDDGEE